MKIKHYIVPRICGKTEFAKKLQMEDPENTLLIETRTLTKLSELEEKLIGNQFKKVVVDEFIESVNKDVKFDPNNFYRLLLSRGCEELVLISTLDKLYSQELILLSTISGEDYHSKYSILNDQIIKNRISEIRRKFLLPHVVEIIKTRFDKPRMEKWEAEMKNQLGEEQYKTKILGEFLK